MNARLQSMDPEVLEEGIKVVGGWASYLEYLEGLRPDYLDRMDVWSVRRLDALDSDIEFVRKRLEADDGD